MPAGWKNPKLQYNFTSGEYEDKKKNYPDLTWKQYRDMKGYPDISNDAIGNSTDFGFCGKHIEFLRLLAPSETDALSS